MSVPVLDDSKEMGWASASQFLAEMKLQMVFRKILDFRGLVTVPAVSGYIGGVIVQMSKAILF